VLWKGGHDCGLTDPALAPRMSQPQPKLSAYTEFHPQPEPRAPLPLTSLPLNALTEEADPTLEIRTLIEQLQQTTRDARAQARAAEQEKDALGQRLARADEEIEALRENERDLRSHFVEVTSLIRERDAAVAESESRGMELEKAAQKIESPAAAR
jgi:hypothetical protein